MYDSLWLIQDKTNEKMDNELENESPGENLTCSAYKGWREREREREQFFFPF